MNPIGAPHSILFSTSTSARKYRTHASARPPLTAPAQPTHCTSSTLSFRHIISSDAATPASSAHNLTATFAALPQHARQPLRHPSMPASAMPQLARRPSRCASYCTNFAHCQRRDNRPPPIASNSRPRAPPATRIQPRCHTTAPPHRPTITRHSLLHSYVAHANDFRYSAPPRRPPESPGHGAT